MLFKLKTVCLYLKRKKRTSQTHSRHMPAYTWDLTLSLQKSSFVDTLRGVDIEPLVTPSFLTSPDCFDKQLIQGQIHPHVCPFSTSTKFWQSYFKKTCPIVDQCFTFRFSQGLRPKLFQWIERGEKVEDKEERKGEKKEKNRSEKKIGHESAKKQNEKSNNKSKFWLMRTRESKILYNLQQKLALFKI